MDEYARQLKSRLDWDSKYRTNLFCRGYLITDARIESTEGYPFYGLWKRIKLGEYTVLVHPEATAFSCAKEGRQAILIGHAYSPKTEEIKEETILNQVLEAADRGEEERNSTIDSLTGVFVLLLADGQRLWATQDCGGQKMLYFGKTQGHVVLTSIPQLAGDVFDLQLDENVERLLNTRGYYRGSGFLLSRFHPWREQDHIQL